MYKYLILLILLFIGCKHINSYKESRFTYPTYYQIVNGNYKGMKCIPLQESETDVYCLVFIDYNNYKQNLLIPKEDLRSER